MSVKPWLLFLDINPTVKIGSNSITTKKEDILFYFFRTTNKTYITQALKYCFN